MAPGECAPEEWGYLQHLVLRLFAMQRYVSESSAVQRSQRSRTQRRDAEGRALACETVKVVHRAYVAESRPIQFTYIGNAGWQPADIPMAHR
jgi:hypothetical protein